MSRAQAAGVFPHGAQPARRGAYRLSLALIAAGTALLSVTAVYNNSAAPPPGIVRYAEVIPLGEGSTASMTSRIELQAPRPVVTSHFVFDRGAHRLYPLAGGPGVPLLAARLDDVAVDGDNLAWVDLEGAPTVNYYDAEKGSVRTVILQADLAPHPGTLAAGDGTIAWSYLRADGHLGAAVLPRGAPQPERYASSLAENRSVAAVLRTDLFYSKSDSGADLFRLNTSGGPEAQVASGLGADRTATGAFFVAWVNSTANRVDYFDVLDRVVEHIAAPADVTAQWVMADGLTMLIGGTHTGLILSSPRVLFYDFGVGAAHLYDSIGVDFDARPYFGFADRTVVSYVEVAQTRQSAPLTTLLLVVAFGVVAAGILEGLRQVFRGDDDL